jgi:hypothetical protein
LQAFSRQVERRSAQRYEAQVGPSSRLLRHERGDAQQLFFRDDLHAGLHRRQAGMKCRHRLAVGLGRWIGQPIATAAHVYADTNEEKQHESG